MTKLSPPSSLIKRMNAEGFSWVYDVTKVISGKWIKKPEGNWVSEGEVSLIHYDEMLKQQARFLGYAPRDIRVIEGAYNNPQLHPNFQYSVSVFVPSNNLTSLLERKPVETYPEIKQFISLVRESQRLKDARLEGFNSYNGRVPLWRLDKTDEDYFKDGGIHFIELGLDRENPWLYLCARECQVGWEPLIENEKFVEGILSNNFQILIDFYTKCFLKNEDCL